MNTYQNNKKPLLAIALTTTLVFGVSGNMGRVNAATDTANLPVSASIANKCKLSNPVAVAFGTYDPIDVNASSPLDANGTFDIRCNKGGSGVMSLSLGQNDANVPSGFGATRAMSDGSTNYLAYELYTTTGRSTVWNTTNTLTYGPAATGQNQTQTVYGRIPGGQYDAVTGNYSDTVVVTVTY